MRRYPGRFQFSNTGYPDAVASIGATLDLLRARCNPGLKIVLTISPVP
jgi:hypothetical protein